MQLQAGCALLAARGLSVEVVTHDGVSDPGQMHAQLVRAAGYGPDQYERASVVTRQRAQVGFARCAVSGNPFYQFAVR